MPIFTIFAFSTANDVDGAVEAGLCFVRLPVTNRQIGWGLETVDKETKGRYVDYSGNVPGIAIYITLTWLSSAERSD
jgi:hypothetical protein